MYSKLPLSSNSNPAIPSGHQNQIWFFTEGLKGLHKGPRGPSHAKNEQLRSVITMRGITIFLTIKEFLPHYL
jgi:hypothetical protein